VPAAKVDEVMVSAGVLDPAATTSEREMDLDKVGLEESLTAKVIGKVPVTVGVPEIAPVVATIEMPEGNLPEVTDHR
jgi:hypothetical protein